MPNLKVLVVRPLCLSKPLQPKDITIWNQKSRKSDSVKTPLALGCLRCSSLIVSGLVVFLTASCAASNYWNTLQHGCYLLLTSRGWYRPFLLFSWSSLSVFIQSADETPAHLASQNSKTSLDGQKALRIHGQTQNRIQKSNCKTA